MSLCYERRGDASAPALLCIHGWGVQLLGWADGLLDAFGALGVSPIVFDNRDTGMSTHLDGAPIPDLWAIALGDHATLSYSIDDMADDAAGLLEAIGTGPAHVLGVSMGGMIAQSLAIRRPDLVASLTSVMSSPDPLHVGTPADEVLSRMLEQEPSTRDEYIDRVTAVAVQNGSPSLGIDEAWLRDT